jgi:hypothetical protein
MLKSKDVKILEEMKNHIKTLSLEERIPAVAIYRVTEKYFQALAVEEAEEDKMNEEYAKAEEAITKQNGEIINGVRACTEEELANLKTFLKEGENIDVSSANVAKPIEQYWFTVLKNANLYMGDADHEALKTLTAIVTKEEVKSDTEKNVFATFKFGPNDFFTNTELSVQVGWG